MALTGDILDVINKLGMLQTVEVSKPNFPDAPDTDFSKPPPSDDVIGITCRSCTGKCRAKKKKLRTKGEDQKTMGTEKETPQRAAVEEEKRAHQSEPHYIRHTGRL